MDFYLTDPCVLYGSRDSWWSHLRYLWKWWNAGNTLKEHSIIVRSVLPILLCKRKSWHIQIIISSHTCYSDRYFIFYTQSEGHLNTWTGVLQKEVLNFCPPQASTKPECSALVLWMWLNRWLVSEPLVSKLSFAGKDLNRIKILRFFCHSILYVSHTNTQQGWLLSYEALMYKAAGHSS